MSLNWYSYYFLVFNMIVKIVEQDGKVIGGIQVYENSFDGTTKVQDTYHISALEYGSDSIFGTNEEEVAVIIDVTEFKENCLIAGEVYNEFEDANDDDFYDCCMESICNRLEVGVGPVSNRAYEIWSIIEEEYL